MLKTARATVSTVVGSALLALLGVGASGAPAHAAPSDCSAGAFCVYSQDGWAGEPREIYRGGLPDPAQYPIENAKSLYNHSSCDVVIFSEANYSGSWLVISRGTAVVSIPSTFGHTIRALEWTNCS
ncbi:peptidase inhibitor family I36 protein [Streptomyces sp. NBC_01235]|uniref:peptidase inhibitor family I36 protein n=1 Tax=Streptomyces sp. NBC_01235 TaxID=2903788 RepID=UPI002E12E88A|nr:peptidase inhibitor family I36 protein [Streptomyces sp. NBC_01235]